jgi:hypothetical protein
MDRMYLILCKNIRQPLIFQMMDLETFLILYTGNHWWGSVPPRDVVPMGEEDVQVNVILGARCSENMILIKSLKNKRQYIFHLRMKYLVLHLHNINNEEYIYWRLNILLSVHKSMLLLSHNSEILYFLVITHYIPEIHVSFL